MTFEVFLEVFQAKLSQDDSEEVLKESFKLLADSSGR